ARKGQLPNGLIIESEYHLSSNSIRAEGTDQTSFSPYNDEPMVDTEGQAAAEKAAEEAAKQAEAKEKKGFSWGKLLKAAVVVVAVVAVVAVSVATFGAGAVIGAALVGAAIGAGVAVAGRAVSDIARGEMSSPWEYLKDAAKGALVGAVTGAVLGPFGGIATQAIGKIGQHGVNAFIGGLDGAFGYGLEELYEGRMPSGAQAGKEFLKGMLFAGILSKASPFISKGFKAVGSKLRGLKDMFSLPLGKQFAPAGGPPIPSKFQLDDIADGNVSKVDSALRAQQKQDLADGLYSGNRRVEPDDMVSKGSEATGKGLLSSNGKFKDTKLQTKYDEYCKRKYKAGETPKDPLKWKEASEKWASLREQGEVFSDESFAKFSQKYENAQKEITIVTNDGTKIRVDAIATDAHGNVIIQEYKSSGSAPFTPNQNKGFPELKNSGGSVVGEGKGDFTEGYVIPSGTGVQIVRPDGTTYFDK
ncbi:hypothetical protein ACFVVF_00005, partial [Paenibacillus sp. NPDC058174]